MPPYPQDHYLCDWVGYEQIQSSEEQHNIPVSNFWLFCIDDRVHLKPGNKHKLQSIDWYNHIVVTESISLNQIHGDN